ncbi:MAG TPA: GntR family transcriptional regulator YhfZ [Conexibacter sp.]
MSAAPSAYLTRAGHVSIEIAKQLILYQPGERVPTVQQFAEELRTGVSTVQRALAILTETGVLELVPRGKRGTFLQEIDRPGLWRASLQTVMVGLMPLPYTRRYEGLATGLRAQAETLGVPFSLAFMSGAASRLDVVGVGEQFAIISALAAQLAREEGRQIEVCLDFGPQSYVEGHALVWAGKQRRRHPRVGVSMRSYDQLELARREFGDHAEYVDVPYLQVLEHLRARHFDVTVWATDAMASVEDLPVTGLTSPAALAAVPSNTAAVLVTAGDHAITHALLRHELDVDAVRRVQAEVLAGARVPHY